jgi:catechol 2,3-dioxygenase-like lactoylglutathione lyase family enzyme
MSKSFRSSRDVIIQPGKWDEAIEFYGKTLGFPVTHQSPTIVGFETGSFCLYVEKGNQPDPVFDFLVPNLSDAKKRLVAAGCKIIDENPAIPRCYIQDPFLVFNIEEKAE